MRRGVGGAKNPWAEGSRWATFPEKRAVDRHHTSGVDTGSSEAELPSFAHQMAEQVASPSSFGSFGVDENADDEEMKLVKPPTVYLYFGFSAVIVGVLMSLVGPSLWMSLVGWTLVGLLAIGLAAAFTLVDARRQSNIYYSARSSVRTFYRVLIVSSLVGVTITAVRIALFVGRS